MTTKTEWFAYFAERRHPKAARAAAEAAPARGVTAPTHRDRKATYALEDSAGRPSRKSTRKASNRQKTDVQYRLKAQEHEGIARAPR